MNNEPVALPNPDRWKKLILVLILINTLIGAVIAFLQTDANIKASQYNVDSQYYAIQASGLLIQQSIEGSYDIASYGEVLKNTQEYLVSEYTALDEASKGNTSASESAYLQATIQQARAEKAKIFSVFYSDPRYAPSSTDQMPNAQAYLDDQANLITPLVDKQNIASDEYHRWSKKSDSYVAILTILAVAFFTLGLGQSLNTKTRLFFAACGLLIMGIGSAWCFLTFIS
jgi:hypothetical protein